MQRATLAISMIFALVGCGDSSQDDGGGGGNGGAGGGGGGVETMVLEVPSGTEVGDELVVDIAASSVGGSWLDGENPGAVLTVTAGANVARDVILVGGFAQETKASLGAWDGGEVTLVVSGDVELDKVELSVDPSAAGLPVIALMTDAFANDTPLVVFKSGDMLEYVMTNEDGGTGFLPPLLVAQWGRPHDIEGLYDLVTHTYQGPDHATLDFDGDFEGTHPRLRMSTPNGLVSPEPADSTARYHVSPVPVAFTNDGVPRERVLDDLPWLVAAGWLEVEREGKIAADGGVDDPMLGALSAYVFVDYDLDGGVVGSFELMVDDVWYSSLGIYAGETGLLDARSSGLGRTAIELPSGNTIADVTGFRVVPDDGAGMLRAARTLAYDPLTYEMVLGGELDTAVAVDAAAGPVELPGF